MLAFIEEFGLEAGLFCIIGQGVKIHIQPIERFSLYILILHLIVDLTIIVIGKVYHEASILFLIKIFEVT